MSRVSHTNAVIDAALADAPAGPGWTRDVPKSFIEATFPFRLNHKGEQVESGGVLLVVPATESKRGRGAPFIDVHGCPDGIDIGISLKVESENRFPRNSIICGGRPNHLFGMILAARSGTIMPVINYWQDGAGQWYRAAFDAGRVLRENPVVLTEGWHKHLGGDFPNPHAVGVFARISGLLGTAPRIAPKNQRGNRIAVSPLKRASGGETRVYLNVKISHDANGIKWTEVDAPAMPGSYGELLEWIGEAGPMIG